MSYLIGISGALGVALIGTVGRFDRDRGFYPTILMVVASYYLLFAAIDGTVSALWVEAGILAIFVAIAMWCIRGSLWIVVAGLAAHGVFDWFHAALPVDTGAPNWWPAFCLAFDVTAAAFVAYLITSGHVLARSPVRTAAGG